MTRAAGIDVSHWQTSTPDLTGLDFLIARVAYGTSLDTKYGLHIANARQAGLVCGAYLFGRYGDGAAQADVMLEHAGDVELFVLDLESDGGNPSMTDSQAKAFMSRIRSAGHPCGLYHSLSGFPNLGQDWNWVAYWGAGAPVMPWAIWQWQGSPLDRNYFNGTREALYEFAGLIPPESATAGGIMPGLDVWNPRPWAGTVVVKDEGTLAARQLDRLAIPLGVGGEGKAATSIAYVPKQPLTGVSGIDFEGDAYLIGEQGAWVLARNVTPHPYQPAEPVGDVAAYNQGRAAVVAAANAVPEKV